MAETFEGAGRGRTPVARMERSAIRENSIRSQDRPGLRSAPPGLRTSSIPIMRRLDESAIMRRTDQNLVHANPRRHAGDESDGAAAMFRLHHFRLLLLRRH